MALRQIVLARKLEALRGQQTEADKQAEVLAEKRTALEKREAELTQALEEITEETPQEDKDALDAEVSQFETDSKALEGEEQQSETQRQAIKNQIAETTSDYDREKLQERLAKLSGGVAVINVGAATEVEMKEKKLRIEDALAATRAAVEEGIVPGGGVALLSAVAPIKKLIKTLSGDEKTGAQIILKAIEEPNRQISKNAGLDDSVIINRILNAKKPYFGFDAYKNEYVDLVESGIIDPTKVTRSALQNASSIASTLLTTESIVTDIPAPEQPMNPNGGMGGMY